MYEIEFKLGPIMIRQKMTKKRVICDVSASNSSNLVAPSVPKQNSNMFRTYECSFFFFFLEKNKCKVTEKAPPKVGRQMSFAMTFSAQVNTEAIKALTMKLFIFQKQLP